jgi:hypothetical protein
MFKRETIKFIIPTSMSSLLLSTAGNSRVVPLYINPSTITTNYTKNISETQTIGGFVIQYWGDRITTMSINGTTGSGGIDAINILYDVYKSEQKSFEKTFIKRQQELLDKANENKQYLDSKATRLEAIDQVLFGGAISELASGVSETMDYFRASYTGENISGQNTKTTLMPTLSAFAVSLEMHYQGRINRGYIDSMNVTESANSPGHFDYTISFKSLKEYGERKNFMPWHTNPYDSSGNPIQKPKVGPDGLNYNPSFPVIYPGTETTAKTISRVTDDQVGTSKETGSTSNTSRLSKIRG